jgi:hypothetical protein
MRKLAAKALHIKTCRYDGRRSMAIWLHLPVQPLTLGAK